MMKATIGLKNNMIIDQDKITPQVLEKIKEVNDEAGYRTYLEVPEMIRIICEVVETNYNLTPKYEKPSTIEQSYYIPEQWGRRCY